MWRERATKSLGNKRTRSLSRSKSLGKTRRPSIRQPPTGAFDFLAERTLLGHQGIPSVVHTTTNSSAIPTQTISMGGMATRSLGSTFPRLRSKSHGHSNSAGTILDGPGHRRKESVSSVLRRAKSTATGFCVGVGGRSTPPDVPDAFIQKDNTKIITLSDRPQGTTSPDSVVLISPTVDHNRTSPDRGFLVPSQLFGVSPTPSNQTQSADGVGIAISSLPPSEEHSSDEQITFPTHPYAQGANNHHRAPANVALRLSETTHHRQPVVHPYAVHSAHPGTLLPQWVHRDKTISPARKMFAEITPGHLREIRPEEIQYSPYVEDAPRIFIAARAAGSAGPSSRMDSDVLRMSDALNLSLARNRLSSSTDSGIGASEDHHPHVSQPERTAPNWPNTFSPRQVHDLLSMVNGNGDEGISHNQWLEPPPTLPRTDSDNSDPISLPTASSSRVNVFTGPRTPMRRIESSGSSPGLSNDSSPPLTPRPLGMLDDLERFQDLFYNPTVNRPRSPELPPITVPTTEPEDQRSATGPVDLTRRRSQLTTLVRQLSEDLYELRNEQPIPEDDGRLEGPDDGPSMDPMTSADSPLSTFSSQHSLDQPVELSGQNFPEDVESEASSLSDMIPREDYEDITGSYLYPLESNEAN